MKTGEILDKIEKLFHSRLENQTNWGKEQVKKLYMECVNEVLRSLI